MNTKQLGVRIDPDLAARTAAAAGQRAVSQSALVAAALEHELSDERTKAEALRTSLAAVQARLVPTLAALDRLIETVAAQVPAAWPAPASACAHQLVVRVIVEQATIDAVRHDLGPDDHPPPDVELEVATLPAGPGPGQCPVCGQPVPSSRATYCSATCRVRAHRQRHGAAPVKAAAPPVSEPVAASPPVPEPDVERPEPDIDWSDW